jgi:HK97 family phage prohead protease
MLLRKTLSLNNVDLKLDGDTGKFSGYASVFGGVDSYGDTIVKGAFSDTLKNHGAPKMFFNHEWGMPIGKYTKAIEDDHGLFVEGELTNGIGLAADVRAAMKHGTLDGLSIGGYVKSGDYEEADAGRVINKWSTLMEVSPVVFPADSSARIDMASVKSIDFESLLPECKTEKEIERLLRDAGLGKWEAMAIISRVRVIVKGSDSQQAAQTKEEALILDRLQRLCL